MKKSIHLQCRFLSVLGAASVIFVAGCDPSGAPLSRVSGHFEGAITNHLDGKTYVRTTVSTDIGQADSSGNVSVVLKDASGATQLTIQIAAASAGDGPVTLQTSLNASAIPSSVALNPNADLSCYTQSGGVNVSLCASEVEVKIDYDNGKDGTELYSVVLYSASSSNVVPVDEKPQTFTLSQAIDRARKMSFASRIEFEHIVQAKARESAAYAELLPRINLGTIANNVTVAPFSFVGTFTTLLQGIGDLLPFLLPDRWFQADQAEKQTEAEQDTARLMSLDTGTQVEGLVYAYLRDGKSRDLTAELLKQTIALRDEIRVRENLGELPDNSTDRMTASVIQIQGSLDVLDAVTADDLASISQSLGFYSPKTVTDITLDTEPVPAESAPALVYDNVNATALNVSLELDQFRALIAAAKDAKTASYFSWLDPQGDPNLSLGFALPSQIEVLDSQANELVIDQQQMQSNLSTNVSTAVIGYTQSLKGFRLAQAALKIQKGLLDDAKVDRQLGLDTDPVAFAGVVQDEITAELALESARANFRVARSTVDRLLLQGFYAGF